MLSKLLAPSPVESAQLPLITTPVQPAVPNVIVEPAVAKRPEPVEPPQPPTPATEPAKPAEPAGIDLAMSLIKAAAAPATAPAPAAAQAAKVAAANAAEQTRQAILHGMADISAQVRQIAKDLEVQTAVIAELANAVGAMRKQLELVAEVRVSRTAASATAHAVDVPSAPQTTPAELVELHSIDGFALDAPILAVNYVSRQFIELARPSTPELRKTLGLAGYKFTGKRWEYK